MAAPPVPALGRHNPRLADLRRRLRHGEAGVAVVDGLKLVLDLAAAGVPMLEVFAAPGQVEQLLGVPALAAAAARGAVFQVEDGVLRDLAPTRHGQGVLALAAVRPRAVPAAGVVLYLDDVQDPGNVGALIRCAAAFAAAGVVCSPACADPFSARAVRASAGHALLIPIAVGAALAPLASAFRAAGGETVVAVGRGGTPAAAWRPRRPLLLVLGNEGRGAGGEVLGACDGQVTVSITAGVESLNVAVAAGVLLAGLAGLAPSPILESSVKPGGGDDSTP